MIVSINQKVLNETKKMYLESKKKLDDKAEE